MDQSTPTLETKKKNKAKKHQKTHHLLAWWFISAMLTLSDLGVDIAETFRQAWATLEETVSKQTNKIAHN